MHALTEYFYLFQGEICRMRKIIRREEGMFLALLVSYFATKPMHEKLLPQLHMLFIQKLPCMLSSYL